MKERDKSGSVSRKSRSTLLRGTLLVIVPAVAIVAALVLSFLLMNNDISRPFSDTPDRNATDVALRSHLGKDNHSSEALQHQGDLGSLLSLRTNFARSVALDNLLKQATFEEALGLLAESKEITETNFRESVQLEIFRKLASLDPKRAVKHTELFLRAHRLGLLAAIFREWSFSDFEAAVVFGEDYIRDFDYRDKPTLLSAILETRHDLSVDAKEKIATRLGLEYLLDQLVEYDRKRALLEDPIKGWHQLMNNTYSNLSQDDILTDIALAVIEKEGFDEFVQLLALLPDRRARTEVLNNALDVTIETDGFQSAFDRALQLVDLSNRSVVFDIAEDWANSDIHATLEAVEKIEDKELGQHVIESVVTNWAKSNPKRLLDNPDFLPEQLRDSAEYNALFWLAVRDPPAATKYLDRMSNWETAAFSESESADLSILRGNVLNNLAGNWSSRDVVGAYRWWLTSPDVVEIRESLFFQIRDRVNAANAETLVNLALEHPFKELGIGNEGAIVVQVASIDPSIAKELVVRVRARPARIRAHAAIGAAMFKQEGNPKISLEYAEELPQGDREEYLLELGKAWAMASPRLAYEYLDKLPSDESRSEAAFVLIWHNSWNRALTEQQISQLRSLLTEEQLEKLKN
ncbi:MAG: hypothetical protein F4X44_02880 [Gammaproteobacteria bacterium]|nr:hypothetical protein [Gammaproteobacteria bacterium]MYD79539.1 hypothetical protein [Gammaproteobacteria bacterium]